VLRDEFPVLERVAYLNAGTCGPVPHRASEAAREALEREVADGRAGKAHFDRVMDQQQRLRSGIAELLGCGPGNVALTHSTTDGINTVLSGLELGPGDEVLTTDEEHPGLLAPLAALELRRGIEVRMVPFAELANEARPMTKLIACSHVSWVNGQAADTDALGATGVPFLLDGAQGIGAIRFNPNHLGCAFYAGSGQKWLCGPEGTGYLWIAPGWVDRLHVASSGYMSLSDPARAAELPLREDAARFEPGYHSAPTSAWALASLGVLGADWDETLGRGPRLAAWLADRLRERGHDVSPRGDTTLVAWRADDDAPATVERLAAAGIVIRDLPGRGLLRASVGAWSSEDELERLVRAVGV